MTTEQKLQQTRVLLRKARCALKLADGIMKYCGGDAWEREATAADRDAFDKLYKEVMP